MNRSLPVLLLASLLVACSSSKAPAVRPVVKSIDPVTDPTVVGAVKGALTDGQEAAEEGARVGRIVGRVAGVIAAVVGAPSSESIDEMVDRYRRTREAAAVVGAVIGATHGAREGAQEGFDLDTQFAELHAIEGIEVLRPVPEEIEVHFATAPGDELLTKVATILTAHDARIFDVAAAGSLAIDVREALIARGIPSANISAHRDDEVQGVIVLVRMRSV